MGALRLVRLEAACSVRELSRKLKIKTRTFVAEIVVVYTQQVNTRSSVGLYENNGDPIVMFKGEFRSPSFLAWNEEYEIAAVSDAEQQCVLLYDINGRLIKKFGRQGALGNENLIETPLGVPAGICWMDENQLLIADRGEHRVSALDFRNFSMTEILSAEQHQLKYPVSLATNRRNRIVLTEEFYDFGKNVYKLKVFRCTGSQRY
jgi:hypothetical protein